MSHTGLLRLSLPLRGEGYGTTGVRVTGLLPAGRRRAS